jgi:hypothetical protein
LRELREEILYGSRKSQEEFRNKRVRKALDRWEKMRKRERENPCFVCGHYHKFEDGEVCGICGHRLQEATEKGPQQSAFSTEILPQFLYLGSYDNASRPELLKAQGISRILNVHTHTLILLEGLAWLSLATE